MLDIYLPTPLPARLPLFLVHCTDDYRYLTIPQLLSCKFSSVLGYDLIYSFRSWPDNQRIQYSIFPDAVLELDHLTVCLNFKRMIGKGS